MIVLTHVCMTYHYPAICKSWFPTAPLYPYNPPDESWQLTRKKLKQTNKRKFGSLPVFCLWKARVDNSVHGRREVVTKGGWGWGVGWKGVRLCVLGAAVCTCVWSSGATSCGPGPFHFGPAKKRRKNICKHAAGFEYPLLKTLLQTWKPPLESQKR